MPERLIAHDAELDEAFEAKESTPPEYVKAQITGLQLTCRKCKQRYLIPLDPDGTMDKGERNAVLQHARAHKRDGLRMRRLP